MCLSVSASVAFDCNQLLILVAPAHALSKQVHEHYLPKLLSHDPSAHAGPTTEAEITTRNRLFNVDGFGMVVWKLGDQHQLSLTPKNNH